VDGRPLYGGYGLGGFFDDGDDPTAKPDADRMATSAIAPLIAVNTLDADAAGGQLSTGRRVGVAGFQNSGAGVDAMVIVQGLPQGTYQVGIDDSGIVAAAPGDGALPPAALNDKGVNPAPEGIDGGRGTRDSANPYNPRRNQPSNLQHNTQPPNLAPAPDQLPNMPEETVPGIGSAPAMGGEAPTDGSAAAGRGAGASPDAPRSAYLAQSLESQQQGAGASSQPSNLQSPGTASQRQLQGRTQQSNPYDPRDLAETQRREQVDGLPSNSPVGSPFVAEIGALQIGPDGMGRVQRRLEGMTVRHLEGMSVIVQSTKWPGAGRFQNDPRIRPRTAASRNEVRQRQNGQPIGQNGQIARGGQGIVAVGQIQLRNGAGTVRSPQTLPRRPNANTDAQSVNRTFNQAPAGATPTDRRSGGARPIPQH
jgi:hypothetical protein